LLDAGGGIDVQGYVDFTNQNGDSSMANNAGDVVAFLNGFYLATTGTQAGAVLRASDGSEFAFTSIRVEVGFSLGDDYRLVGYLDGSAVAGATHNFTAGAYGSGGTLVSVSGAAWLFVDEVRIVRQNGGVDISVYIDDIVVASAVPPLVLPSLSATGANPTFTEGGSAVDLFSGVTAATNDGGQTFSGLVLTVSNLSNGASEIINIGGTDVALSNGNSGSIAGIGNFSVSVVGSTATVTLSGMTRSDAQMGTLIDGMTYRNLHDDPGNSSRVVTIASITDSGASANIATPNIASTVSLTAVNDAPGLSATPGNPTYTENGSAVDLFGGITISSVESGQTITGLTLTITNLADGSHEILRIDDTDIALTNGNAAITVTNNLSVLVSVTGGTATVTITKVAGISSAAAQTVVDGLSYRNASDAPNSSNRVVTLTSIADSGGTANGGSDTASLAVASTVTVVPVNDAPTLAGGPFVLTGTDENSSSAGTLVSTVLAGLTYGDVDSAALVGLAITASSGNGTWQYSTDGLTWNGVGSVSVNAALLLSGSTQLRYVPDSANGETAVLTFCAWDQSSGTASTNLTRNTADTSSNGGITAFSTGTAQASVVITSLNDAPILTPTAPVLAGITDGEINNAGQTVASFVGTSIDDVDNGAIEGIAITALVSGTGTWQFSIDNGGNWSAIDSV
ncbi:hypothetical protein HP532_23145, partial [Pseudomonas sp. CrR25]|nr:hypothetical protein [Pseudomonas sp. CrR25]